MEDNSKSRNFAANTDNPKKKIIELAPEMELPPGGGRIIDLNRFIDEPDVRGGDEDEAGQSEPEKDMQTGVSDASDPQNPDEEPETGIEAEVDAAFDAFGASDTSDSFEAAAAMEAGDLPDAWIEPAQLQPSPAEPLKENNDPEDDEAEISLTDIVDSKEFESAPLLETTPEEQPDEEDMIELSDMIVSEDGQPIPLPETALEEQPDEDDMIELTDMIESEDGQPTPLLETALEEQPDEDDMIELVDMIESEDGQPAPLPETALEEQPEEDMIELTDMIESEDGQPAPLPETATEEQPDEDDMIELVDAVDLDEIAKQLEAAQGKAFRKAPDARAFVPYDDDDEDDEQIIQLTDVLARRPSDSGKAQALQDATANSSAANTKMHNQNEIAETFGPVTFQQIEAAIEKVIQTRYADTIERLIAQAVEKAVTSEIQSIKRTFMDDSDPSE